MRKMLKVKNISEILGCSLDKSYAIISQKGFPVIKIGKNYYIPEDEFEKWIKNNLYKEVLM